MEEEKDGIEEVQIETEAPAPEFQTPLEEARPETVLEQPLGENQPETILAEAEGEVEVREEIANLYESINKSEESFAYAVSMLKEHETQIKALAEMLNSLARENQSLEKQLKKLKKEKYL